MRRTPTAAISALCVFFCAQVHFGAEPEHPVPGFQEDVRPFFAMYCADCHGGDEPEGDLKLDAFEETPDVVGDLEKWTAIAELVEAQEMPPEDEPQPGAEERRRFLAWAKLELARFDCQNQEPQPGRVTVRRLNRTEYNNTIRDLFGIDFRPAEDFPADDVGEGFDNIADVLSLPPLLMEKYLEAAEQITSKALADERSRNRVIHCWPEDGKSRQDCTHDVIQSFGKLVFRRPLRNEEIERLANLAQVAEQRGASYQQGIELVVQAMLISPEFLFRIELDAQDDVEIRPLNDYELATRLSYFLWSSIPDAELYALADTGQADG